MGQIIKLRRSSVSGQKPTNTNLQLGELALNTTDGKAFMAVSGSLGPSVEEFILTNTYNTGSIFLSGSITTDNINVKQNAVISGSLRFRPTQDPDITGQNLTDTFLFQSSSNNTLGNDLYIRQDGNLVKWKWVEGLLNTGILYGGIVTWSGSQVYISSGSGIIVNHNVSSGYEITPTISYVTWDNITSSINNLSTTQVTYLLLDSTGQLQQQNTLFTSQQYHESLPLGAVGHFDYQNIVAFGSLINTSYDQTTQVNSFIDAFGPLKISGFQLSGKTENLGLSVGSGISFIHGGFYTQNQEYPSTYTSPPQLNASIIRCYTSGSDTIFDTNNNLFYNNIDPTKYDNNGTLLSISNNNWTIQRVYSYPLNNILYVYYGQNTYPNLDSALNALGSDNFQEGLATQPFTVFLGYLVVKSNAVSLEDTDSKIISAGLFRGSGVSSSGGGATATTINDLVDTNITTPTNGQSLIYQSGLWVNGVPTLAATSSFVTTLNQNVSISGSLFLTGSISSPTITTLTNRLVSLENVTGSYSITGSNTFNGNQTIYGTINLNGSQLETKLYSNLTNGINLLHTVDVSTYSTLFIDYYVNDGTNMRAGTITSVWDGTLINFNEVTTNDIGNTNGINFSLDISGGFARLIAIITSGTWTIKTLMKSI